MPSVDEQLNAGEYKTLITGASKMIRDKCYIPAIYQYQLAQIVQETQQKSEVTMFVSKDEYLAYQYLRAFACALGGIRLKASQESTKQMIDQLHRTSAANHSLASGVTQLSQLLSAYHEYSCNSFDISAEICTELLEKLDSMSRKDFPTWTYPFETLRMEECTKKRCQELVQELKQNCEENIEEFRGQKKQCTNCVLSPQRPYTYYR